MNMRSVIVVIDRNIFSIDCDRGPELAAKPDDLLATPRATHCANAWR
jgi:hypothetical protein